MATTPGYPVPRPDAGADDVAALRQHGRDMAAWARETSQGKLNVTTTLTLAAGVTTTTLTDPRLRSIGNILLLPLTANAAAALATTYVLTSSMNDGSWTVTHANTATTDRTFRVSIIG